MTRARLYVLIDAFENDMRQVMNHYILDHLSEEEALGASYPRANQRRASDQMGDQSSITAYLDLQECYDILNRHRESLPADLGRELKDNTVEVNALVPIRNRVMHGRPLGAGDPERALSACQAFTTRYWKTVTDVITHLRSDAAWQPIVKGQGTDSDLVLHNLPLPEYDETGLIGRNEDSKNILRFLLRRREPIVTLVGEGGIGKTALALDVAYKLIDDPECPYECVLWVSLKTERLTASGVVEIADAARDLTGAATRLGQVFDTSFSGGVSGLSDALSGIPTLLIIDNLETVAGDEVSALYDDLPDSVNYLFTSRVGIGQLERRIVVKPLAGKDANYLFRNFAKARGVTRLASLSDKRVTEVVKALRNSPLAIRWYIMAVEAGAQPNLALTDQSALLDFCVRSVYERMSHDAQNLLAMLFALDRMSSFDELAVLVDISVDRLRKSVQELLSGSMVVWESDGADSLTSKVSLTESARNFLRAVNPPRSDLIEETLARERQFRRSEERRRADAKARQLAPNVVRTRTNDDIPTAHLLREALSASRRETFNKAIEYVNRARQINPSYWEVDRVEAFLLSAEGYTNQATTVYRNALRKARDDGDNEGMAVVSYYFSGHLSRQANEPEQALDYAKTAHEYFKSSETALGLGRILMWIGNFEEAQSYLEESLEEARGKARLIAITTIVDSWCRWADNLLTEQRRPAEAADKAYAGFSVGVSEINAGTYDARLSDQVISTASLFLKCIGPHTIASSNTERQLAKMLKFVDEKRIVFTGCRGYRSFLRNLSNLSRERNLPPHARLIQEVENLRPPSRRVNAGRDSSETSESGQDFLVGSVRAWLGTYGFIAHDDFPDNVFFPASVVRNLRERGTEVDLANHVVKFFVEQSDGPRPRAEWVEVQW
ncbi:NB-ARC domain-containing protein [Amycolatopsis rhizosphaerae]|nr:NB-ARC domain-containing protein [Amycolatopsis rhizosphaerae]